jgi:NADH:ubiquinone oxidoreductase subunit K
LLLNSLSWLFDDFSGILFSIFLLPIAGCEAAIGLILLVRYAPSYGTTHLN